MGDGTVRKYAFVLNGSSKQRYVKEAARKAQEMHSKKRHTFGLSPAWPRGFTYMPSTVPALFKAQVRLQAKNIDDDDDVYIYITGDKSICTAKGRNANPYVNDRILKLLKGLKAGKRRIVTGGPCGKRIKAVLAKKPKTKAPACKSSVSLKVVQRLRKRFMKFNITGFERSTKIHSWGQALLKLCGVQETREAAAGAKALRRIITTNKKVPRYSLDVVDRAMALKWYEIITKAGLFSQTELVAGAKAACAVTATGIWARSGLTSYAFKVLVAVWGKVSNKSSLHFSANIVIDEFFKYHNPVVVEEALLLFTNSMARHVPVNILKKALRVMMDIQKNGIIYTDPRYPGGKVRYKASNVTAVIRQAIPVLKKLLKPKP